MRSIVGFGALFLVVWQGAGTAGADTADALITSTNVDLIEASDRSLSVEVELANISTTELSVRAVPGSSATADCVLSINPASLQPNVGPAKVTMHLSAGCQLNDGRFAIVITAGTSRFAVSATESKTPPTDWKQLYVFVWALVASAVLAGVTWYICNRKGWRELSALDAEWNFKDAWASNATILGGILTGIVGSSSVVKAVLGSDADAAIALATVGVAIGAAFAAAGPVTLSTFKRNGKYTTFGLVFGGAFVLTGASGELWVVAYSGTHLEQVTGWADRFIWGAAVLAFVLLILYLVVNTVEVISDGTAEAETTADPALVAAVLHVRLCCDKMVTGDDLRQAAKVVQDAVTEEADREVEATSAPEKLSPLVLGAVSRRRGVGI